jgi:hypothetical protein
MAVQPVRRLLTIQQKLRELHEALEASSSVKISDNLKAKVKEAEFAVRAASEEAHHCGFGT